ncbi:hypothetical protein COT97_04075 [Candidatus Falkowbacteria bacterium CG10_big_fil_rev_8_21_14_0_10_39_11]|uniref:Uncharacterized protein n=1 Tax=Candidatus Falkowbacteria bacterium CG10_big_fil_rev_8_21_14_0_10_39_11 TaxID=1974565 RepID=A0A2H0V458_9BACT|nr:MAG: hypothetical protein COT97_04075 [Candidatus Falkowbacteria bacterium CG10_big_fil_rev_8_21_14_0_10_39_11]
MASKAATPTQKTRHHMVPSSRCIINDEHRRGNIRIVPREIHEAWHTIFHNMTPYEIVLCIILLWAPIGFFRKVKLHATWEFSEYKYTLGRKHKLPSRSILVYEEQYNKYPAEWRILFDHKTFLDIIAEVVEYWSPKGYFIDVELHARDNSENFYYEYHHEEKL